MPSPHTFTEIHPFLLLSHSRICTHTFPQLKPTFKNSTILETISRKPKKKKRVKFWKNKTKEEQ